jgi:hypothetical protein
MLPRGPLGKPSRTSRASFPLRSRAAVEIAGALGACSPADVDAVLALGVRLKDVLSRLIR